MTVRRAAAVTSLTVIALTGLAGPAAAVCDAYSGTCTEPPGVLNNQLTPPAQQPAAQQPAGQQPAAQQPAAVRGASVPAADTPATLPFTGGELVLASTLGIGTLAGGIVLVVAGRRRATTPAA